MHKIEYRVGDLVMLVGPQPDRPPSLISWLPEMEDQMGGPYEITCKDGKYVSLRQDSIGFWFDSIWLDPYEPEEQMDEPFSMLEVLHGI